VTSASEPNKRGYAVWIPIPVTQENDVEFRTASVLRFQLNQFV